MEFYISWIYLSATLDTEVSTMQHNSSWWNHFSWKKWWLCWKWWFNHHFTIMVVFLCDLIISFINHLAKMIYECVCVWNLGQIAWKIISWCYKCFIVFPFKVSFWHDDVIKWKHFPRYWPFVRGIHRSLWIPRTKASDMELWCFLWSALE